MQAIAVMKLKQIDEATLAEKQQIEVFLDRMKAERERKALEARYEAALPEIARNLQVFIAKGYAQPDGPARMMKTVKLEPVSLAGLRAAGALDESTKGLQALLDLGSNFHNDRFKGNFPIQGVLTTKQIPILQQAQNLLREFGPIMVEKGLLSP